MYHSFIIYPVVDKVGTAANDLSSRDGAGNMRMSLPVRMHPHVAHCSHDRIIVPTVSVSVSIAKASRQSPRRKKWHSVRFDEWGS